MKKLINKLELSPIIPVLTFNDENKALKITDILVKFGLTNLEITLRTKNAINCIKAIIKEFPTANVGAGTVIFKEQLQEIQDIGCAFAVSPGSTPSLIAEARKINFPFLPGASTPSEIIALIEQEVYFQKFFHAENSGGYKVLKAYANIFPMVKFCPTGGIGQNNFRDYLNLNNTLCLGGSWLVDSNMSLSEIESAVLKLQNPK